ncbi:MAG: FAD-dependent oxidoreductase [Magnetococcales bacterium]|nr:FAD-dependent oxidoreductase [Magnetococcales bacterium]
MSKLTRRNFVKLTSSVAAVGLTACAGGPSPSIAGNYKHRVVIIGGGYAGAVAAKYIRMADSSVKVTLIEQNKNYYSCPLSNWVVAGFRDIEVQKWGYNGLKGHGVEVVHEKATKVDPVGKKVTTASGNTFKYDQLVVSPGVGFRDLEGYDMAASHKMPHAWKAGPQTVQLAKQLKAMKNGDPFIMVAPPNPFRCPPGPYERASLVAHFLKKHKPKSKVLILDAKDKFSKFGLFTGGWKQLYGYGTANSMIEWVPGGEGGKVSRVDAKSMTVYTEMEEFTSSCINVIPAQKANQIAVSAGLTDKKGWCPVNLKTFESKMHKDVYVIGDSSAAAGLPKSGYAANSEAKVCASAIVAKLNHKAVPTPSYVNTCYSMLSPDYGISVAAVYKFDAAKPNKVQKVAGGLSPSKAPDFIRKQEALYNESWYQSIMADTFG